MPVVLRGARRCSLLVLLLVATGVVLLGPTAPARAADVLAQDSFDRTVSSGLGTAPTGGTWATQGTASSFGVSSSAARLSLAPGQTLSADLGRTATAATSVATFSVDRVAEGTYVALVGRRAGGSAYVARIRLQADGRVRLYLLRDHHALTSSLPVPGVTVTAGQQYRLSLKVDGTSPTTLGAKVWAVGSSEPGTWQASATDTAAALQQAGTTGFFGYLPSSVSQGVKLAVSDYAVTGASTSSTGDASAVAPPPTSTSTAGAAPVGTTTYAVPSNAVYAVAGGGTAGSGTASSPYQSAQTAIEKAPSGATVVLRKGTYREFLRMPAGKKLTVQAYPNEAVWFDGARPVTGWTRSGSTWVVSGWTPASDGKTSLTPGVDETSRYVDPAYPMAGHPDAVWVAGVEQTQVASASQVTTGTFYVDRTNKRLVLGTDPTGRVVEASTIARAMKIQSPGSTIRGIGVRRYATPLSGQGAIGYEVDDLTFENVVVADNATIGFFGWGDRATFRNVTITGNGILGLHADSADGLRVLGSVLSRNNDQRFRSTPISSGAKLTDSADVVVKGSVFDDNHTTGLWFDVSMRHVTVVGNHITDNGAAGLEFELSGHAVIADNYVARNREGIFLFNANDVDLWNNTLDRNERTFQVLQDARRQGDTALKTTVPWVTSNIAFHNNAVAYGTNTCPVLTQDLTRKWYGNDFDIASNGNAFHRASSTSPSKFACWANGADGTTSFSSLPAWTTATTNDKVSKLFEGTAILTSTGALTSSASSSTTAVPLGLPSDVAAAIGRPAGERALGAYLVR